MAADSYMAQPNTQQPVSLSLRHTLKSPSGLTRAWSSRPHLAAKTPLLATAYADRSVQIWDLRDYKLVSTITGGHKRSIRCVGWKDWGTVDPPSGGTSENQLHAAGAETGPEQPTAKIEKPVTLATGSFDSNVGIWVHDPPSQRASRRNVNDGDDDEIDVGAIEEQQEGDDPNEEEEWNFTTLLTGPDSEIKDLAFSPPHYGANLLATCSRDKSVWVWEEVEDDNEWETIAVLGDHTGDVKCVSWCAGAIMTTPSTKTSGSEDEETTILGGREILATGSYDDTIRLWRDVEEEGDWICVGVIDKHQGTVWDLCWEGYFNRKAWKGEQEGGVAAREWEPRLVSCSDDTTVRIWRRELSESEKEKKRERLAMTGSGQQRVERLPSVIRTTPTTENWVQDSKLPDIHVRSVYAVDWSRKTGLIVSCGGEGTIAVYKEVALDSESSGSHEENDVVMNGTTEAGQDEYSGRKRTRWILAATIEAAHDEYEVNHVCWAPRRDRDRRWENEEVIISTGDDGDVRIWTIPNEITEIEWKG